MRARFLSHNRKQTLTWSVGLMVLMVVLLAACQPAATAVPTSAPTATTPPSTATAAPSATLPPAAQEPSPAVQEPVVNVASNATLGEILVDGKGMTLYMFTKDSADQSNCTGGCLTAWPPLITQGKPQAGEGVDAALLGTAALADGRMIVTYNHMPLYYWQGDTQPGQATGQGVNEVWYVLSPDGQVVGLPGQVPATGGETAEPALVINVVKDATLGEILVDGRGMTLYMFTKDTADQSNCTGGCLTAWPPLVAEGEVKAGEGVDPALIGEAELADGRKIVTYNHMPLYYWQADTQPGQTTGQGVNEVWYVVNPAGEAVKEAPTPGY